MPQKGAVEYERTDADDGDKRVGENVSGSIRKTARRKYTPYAESDEWDVGEGIPKFGDERGMGVIVLTPV